VASALAPDHAGGVEFYWETTGRSKRVQQSVDWLLHLAPAAASAAEVRDCLVRLPAVPLPWARQMVRAGVRMSYAQLLAAADSMVYDVNRWVQAQQQLGVETDIPEVAVAICCEGLPDSAPWVSFLLLRSPCSALYCTIAS
jgi:hypothetical protein